LLVVRHRDYLEAVRQGTDLVRRELDVSRRQRLRWPLRRPVRHLRGSRHRDERGEGEGPGAEREPHCCPPPADAPLGMMVITRRFSGVKYCWATRWTSA